MRSSIWSPPRLSNTFAFISLQISASCGPCTLLYRPGEEFANCEIHLDSFAICEFNVVEAALEHHDLGGPLDIWYRIAKKAGWRNLMEVRLTFPTADAVGRFTIFNIKGNAYRLITEINYRTERIFLRHVLTHAEYDKGAWKL